MRIGALRQRISIQYKTTVGSTNEGHFEGREVWLNWRENVPCSVTVRRGQEHFASLGDGGGGQRYSKDVYFFNIRQPSIIGVDSSMRVVHKGNLFDIRHIRPDGQFGRELTLECEVQDAVIGAAPLIPAINTVIPIGTAGQTYQGFVVSASGGTAPYTFVADSGSLLPGLEINEATGEISGIPTQIGEWPCSVIVSDASGAQVPLSFTIVVTAASVTDYSYTVTAGESGDWVGYLPVVAGSIDGEPIDGGMVTSTVASKAVVGEGGIEIAGSAEVLHAALVGKDVWIDGVKLVNPDGWTFQSNLAVWWVSSGFPQFTSGNDYLVEIK